MMRQQPQEQRQMSNRPADGHGGRTANRAPAHHSSAAGSPPASSPRCGSTAAATSAPRIWPRLRPAPTRARSCRSGGRTERAGKRLWAIREAAGLNQIQLAAASGLTHEAISRLETGRCWPYAETVRKLAGALGVEPERFIARDKTGLTLLTVAEAASRLGVPGGRVQTLAAQGSGLRHEVVRGVASPLGGHRRARPQRTSARALQPPRPALPRLTGLPITFRVWVLWHARLAGAPGRYGACTHDSGT